MILVDSSVWIDYFNGRETRETSHLDSVLGMEPIAIGDLMLAEILQGFRSDRDFETAKETLLALDILQIGGTELALAAAKNFRTLRKRGITVRKTIDVLIATRAIRDGFPLLFSDRDFEPFVEHLELLSALTTDDDSEERQHRPF